MDREIPKGKTDLHILSAAYKWHPYAARTLPVTSPLQLCVNVCVCVHMFEREMKEEACENVMLKQVFVEGSWTKSSRAFINSNVMCNMYTALFYC